MVLVMKPRKDLDLEGRIILKDTLKKRDRKMRTGYIWHTIGEMRRNLIDTVTVIQSVLNGGNV
jgi:hypothetical protein